MPNITFAELSRSAGERWYATARGSLCSLLPALAVCEPPGAPLWTHGTASKCTQTCGLDRSKVSAEEKAAYDMKAASERERYAAEYAEYSHRHHHPPTPLACTPRSRNESSLYTLSGAAVTVLDRYKLTDSYKEHQARMAEMTSESEDVSSESVTSSDSDGKAPLQRPATAHRYGVATLGIAATPQQRFGLYSLPATYPQTQSCNARP